jgi:hypothetical protein
MKITTPGAQKNTNHAAEEVRKSYLTILFINNIGQIQVRLELVWQMPLFPCWGLADSVAAFPGRGES